MDTQRVFSIKALAMAGIAAVFGAALALACPPNASAALSDEAASFPAASISAENNVETAGKGAATDEEAAAGEEAAVKKSGAAEDGQATGKSGQDESSAKGQGGQDGVSAAQEEKQDGGSSTPKDEQDGEATPETSPLPDTGADAKTNDAGESKADTGENVHAEAGSGKDTQADTGAGAQAGQGVTSGKTTAAKTGSGQASGSQTKQADASAQKTAQAGSAQPATTAATAATAAKAATTSSTATAKATAKTVQASTAAKKAAQPAAPKGGTRVLVDGHIYIFYSAVSGKSIEAYGGGTANKTAITQYATNNMTPQQWRVKYDADNYVTFYNVKSGKVIDVANGKAVKRGKVWLFKYNGTLAQKWVVTKLSGGGYRIVSAKNTAIALDLYNASRENDARIWLFKTNGSAAQKWSLYDVTAGRAQLKTQLAASKKAFSAGVYEIVTAISTNKVLDVENGSLDKGANVRLWMKNKTQAQFWSLSYDAKGYAHFTNVKSNKALEVANGKSANCTNVRQWTKNTGAAQKWVFVSMGNGAYRIVSAVFPNVCLDAYGGSSKNGTNVQIYRSNKTKAQKWKLRSVTALISNGIYEVASRVNVKRVLDLAGAGHADSTKIQIWDANRSYAQKWYFKRVAANTYTIQSTESGKYLTTRADGSLYQHAKNTGSARKAQRWVLDVHHNGYVLKNVQTGKYLDLAAGTNENGATVQTWSWIGGAPQRWKLTSRAHIEAGVYYFVSALSGNAVMGASCASTAVGANVALTSQAYYDTQKWVVSRNSDGTYNIVNAAAGLALDVQDGRKTSGANIRLWSGNGSAAQRWHIYWCADGYFTMAPDTNTRLRVDVENGRSANETNIRCWISNESVAQGWRLTTASYNPPNDASMRGIDIASWEAGIDIWSVDADFVVVKVSQGTTYTNPYWRAWAEATLQSGKKLGLYHYAAGDEPEDEANFFLNQIGDYVGRAVLVIDWEAGQNRSYSDNGEWWTSRWRAQVKNRTGKTAWTYISQNISRYYSGPLWIAQYPNYDVTGYQDNPWNEGAYSCVCRQYTSSGDISGYNGLLDLNKFYGSASDWDAWAQGRSA